MSSQLTASYVVETVGGKPKNVKSADRVPKCRVSWPRAWMSSQLTASYVVETVGRVRKRVVILYISEMF